MGCIIMMVSHQCLRVVGKLLIRPKIYCRLFEKKARNIKKITDTTISKLIKHLLFLTILTFFTNYIKIIALPCITPLIGNYTVEVNPYLK